VGAAFADNRMEIRKICARDGMWGNYGESERLSYYVECVDI